MITGYKIWARKYSKYCKISYLSAESLHKITASLSTQEIWAELSTCSSSALFHFCIIQLNACKYHMWQIRPQISVFSNDAVWKYTQHTREGSNSVYWMCSSQMWCKIFMSYIVDLIMIWILAYVVMLCNHVTVLIKQHVAFNCCFTHGHQRAAQSSLLKEKKGGGNTWGKLTNGLWNKKQLQDITAVLGKVWLALHEPGLMSALCQQISE